MMSLPNDIVYLQFHPLAYLVKLHIEMNMAGLITKVVKASNPSGYPDYSNSRSRSNPKSSQRAGTTTIGGSKKITSMFAGGNVTFVEAGGDDIELPTRDISGIQKTTTTQVVIKSANNSGQDYDDHDFASESSSTRQLKREHFAVWFNNYGIFGTKTRLLKQHFNIRDIASRCPGHLLHFTHRFTGNDDTRTRYPLHVYLIDRT